MGWKGRREADDLGDSLSFGTGGKDKETGEVSRGWGYYEVSAPLGM